ncbi:hypothetical protein [Mesobacillus harenae]|uniref:hypothetical protein n=1 Tax=Mesobacillus harenae TaxID=2213203 RepID=UPI001580A2A3|nr:hypothetical protein [Mesobacillus harenae]
MYFQKNNPLGIHPTNITMVEREHRRAWPKLRRQIAEELGVVEDLLFDEKGNLKRSMIKINCL